MFVTFDIVVKFIYLKYDTVLTYYANRLIAETKQDL